MQWAEIQIETTAQAQDAVANLLMEIGCGGTVSEGETSVFVTCYLPVDDRLEERLYKIRAGVRNLPEFGIESAPGEITVRYAEQDDWAEAWKNFFKTVHVGKRIVVKPSWEEYKPAGKEVVIEIDPGMAFGTGNHPTTRLCIEALEKHLKPRKVVVDFGTGSGILAIAAAKLGARLVIAFDYDDQAVRAARANVQRNDLEDMIEVHQADNPAFINIEADVIAANLLAEIVIAEAQTLVKLLKVGGVVIASGITKDKRREVEQALKNVGLEIVETLREGEWVAIVGQKTA